MTTPIYVCEELLKLQHIDFYDNPLIIEMSKAAHEQLNHYSQPPLQPPPIQRVVHSYENTQLNFALPPVSLEYYEYLAGYELFFRDTLNLEIFRFERELLKCRLKDLTFFVFRDS